MKVSVQNLMQLIDLAVFSTRMDKVRAGTSFDQNPFNLINRSILQLCDFD